MAIGVIGSCLVLSHNEQVSSASRTLFSGIVTIATLTASAVWGLYSLIHCFLVGFWFTPWSLGPHWLALVGIICLASESATQLVCKILTWVITNVGHGLAKRFANSER